jgi:hypothetical protein
MREAVPPPSTHLHRMVLNETQAQTSLYSDWLRVGQPRGRISSPVRVKSFTFSTSSRRALGSTQPPIQRIPGALSPRVKRPGLEVDHSTPASAEIKQMWIYNSNPPHAFMA